MDNNNDWLRRSSRPAAVLAFCAVVSACQSTGPEHAAAATALPMAAAVPLEPIVLPSLEYRDTVVEQDLLTRLRSRFAWEIKSDPVVERELAWYAKNQAYLDRVFKRSDPYLYHIVGELEARGMPAELALL